MFARRSLIAVAAALGASPVFAFQVTVPLVNQIAWSGSTPFGRAVAGRFSAGMPKGVVQMRGSDAHFLTAPAVLATHDLLLASVNDVATVKQSGTIDALAVVAPSTALRIGTYSSSSGTWTFNTVSLSAWTGAKLVRSANLDASAGADLLGVASDARTILRALVSGGSYTDQSTFTLGYDVLDIEPIDWDGGALEIAVLTTWGVEVYDQSGTRLWWRACPQSGSCMAVLGENPNLVGDHDLLALVAKASSGANQYLVVANSSGTHPAVALGDAKITRMSSGDWDDDGDADLVLAHTAAPTLRVFRNDGGSPSFSTSAELAPYSAGDPSQTSPNAYGTPLLLDLDGDADPSYSDPLQDRDSDVYYACSDSGLAVFYPAVPTYVPSTPPGTNLQYSGTPHAIFRYAEMCTTEPSEAGSTADVVLGVKNGWATDTSTSDATHLELTVWTEPVSATSSHNVASLAVLYKHFDASTSSFFTNDTQEGRIAFSVPSANAWSCSGNAEFHEKFYLLLRPIKVDASTGEITKAWRNAVGSFTGDFYPDSSSEFPHFNFLLTDAGAWQGAITTTTCGGNTGSTPGGYVPRTQLPPIPPPVTIPGKTTGSIVSSS